MEIKPIDAKKAEHVPSVAETKVSRRKTLDYVEQIKSEFKAINWTSREELKVYTQITVGATFVFGMFIYFADILIQSALGLITWGMRLITG